MTPDSLWAQAGALFALPGARAELLHLQDRCGADVPMLLWAAALALGHERLDLLVARAARAKAEAVAEGVRAVRAVRRKLPDLAPTSATETARSALLGAELALERVQLDRLAEHQGVKDRAASLLDNLHTALAACGCVASPGIVERLALIFADA